MNRPILRFGHPKLNEKCVAADLNDPTLVSDQDDLLSALHTFQQLHGWGRAISAPQLGIQKRMMAVTLDAGPEILLNPELTWTSAATREIWDDCMSLPEIAVRVSRFESVSVSFVRRDGSEGLLDRVSFALSELLQHELDHLDGILMTQRMLPGSPVVAREMRDHAVWPNDACPS